MHIYYYKNHIRSGAVLHGINLMFNFFEALVFIEKTCQKDKERARKKNVKIFHQLWDNISLKIAKQLILRQITCFSSIKSATYLLK